MAFISLHSNHDLNLPVSVTCRHETIIVTFYPRDCPPQSILVLEGNEQYIASLSSIPIDIKNDDMEIAEAHAATITAATANAART